MKFLSLLMAILMLVLSCIPCSDTEGVPCTAPNQELITQAATSHRDAHQEDVCSPFCQCACCAIAYALPLNAALPQPLAPIYYRKPLSAFLPQRPVSISLPVWQPPQLV